MHILAYKNDTYTLQNLKKWEFLGEGKGLRPKMVMNASDEQ